MKSFRRVGMLTLCCLLPLRVLAAQNTAFDIRLGYAHDLRDGQLPGSWGGAFALSRIFHQREWGVELGYATFGTSPGTATAGPSGTTVGTHSQSAFELGPTLALPLGTSPMRPTLQLGFGFYRLDVPSDTTFYDAAGFPLAGFKVFSRRDGFGPSVGATIYPVGSRNHTALSLTLRLDTPLTHETGSAKVGPSGWVFYPYLSVGAGVRWHVRRN